MSNIKNGFSTLNRLLGRKNKDKAVPNGKLSKSSTNLSVSTTNINETSQLEYNRITPLPAATSNAPFEQTFRITVLLPKDQLYVSRLGARVPLSKLLELVCENKLLDSDKYEFRNPVDPSQVYSCELTIGAVGLSEIRLCLKSDSYDTFNTDEVLKLHRTSVRDSLSSSEFSSRNSKHTAKTASPYSSSNSLNSMDSTGMNCVRTPVTPPSNLSTTTTPKVAAPPRKKRTAPRPPSQIVIPEKSALIITNGDVEHANESLKNEPLPRKDYYVSTPNLSSPTFLNKDISSTDCNGNTKHIDELNLTTKSIELDVQQRNARNNYSNSVQNLTNITTEQIETLNLPEPSPRKRLIQIKKKSAPVPPSKNSTQSDDTLSISSANFSIPGTPVTPVTPDVKEITAVSETILPAPTTNLNNNSKSDLPTPAVRETTISKSLHSSTPLSIADSKSSTTCTTTPTTPKPVPRLTTTTLLNATNIETDENLNSSLTTNNQSIHSNISKVMLNRTPTPEPRSLSSEPPELTAEIVTQLSNGNCNEDDNISKQADSGIGEPVPSPIPDSIPSEGSAHECKSTFESSSDDDDMIKVYNFKLGKTVIKPSIEHKTLEELTSITATQTDSDEATPITQALSATPGLSEKSSWNFSIPISPPANFADDVQNIHGSTEKIPDPPITPKIKQRPVLNFDSVTKENLEKKKSSDTVDHSLLRVEKTTKTHEVLPSPTSPITEIIDELSMIINENRIDSVIKKASTPNEIETAKPNTLSNFTIATISYEEKPNISNSSDIEKRGSSSTPESCTDEEKLYRKHNNIANSSNVANQRKAVTRSDSFHTTVMQTQIPTKVENSMENINGLQSRSSSYLSLTKLEQNGALLNRRRSSSELSIGESPSLQSLEVIKTILNSRKNSLASSSDGESKSAIGEVSKNIESYHAHNSAESRKITTVELKPKNDNSNDTSRKPASVEEVEHDYKRKEVPKVYRYSGPPSINFSTWSERPKAQVSIKNEGDYIFGGKNANSQNAAVTTAAVSINTNSMPRNYRNSTPAGTFSLQKSRELHSNEPPTIEPKPVTLTMRMGIPEKSFKVPITVKPLKDVTVETTQLDAQHAENKQTNTKFNKSITTVTLNTNTDVTDTTDTVVKRTFTQVSKTSTLPRNNSNRFSTPVVGPSLLRTTSINQLKENRPKSEDDNKSATPGPALLRTTSINQLKENRPRTEEENKSTCPFGQNTLRKTGLKEKILANEEKKVEKVNESTKSNQVISITSVARPVNTTKMNANNTPVSPTKTLQSAKLELKIQKSTNVFVNQTNSRTTQINSAPILTTNATPPPPPPMAPLKATPIKSFSTPANGDPRDQLLAAIRNFKRDELKRT
ncbi:uncharacterized threonine-rich GPI-anchored glycoprotein PJ4664.02 [Teleopsis dalmanni]|uniref:uncharacterized threonine-rich GPI-anchored glycoprotein PJ4664.02 n=1 Tax=Teleopsis dalmanni TaxID=139649 RepID=UPI0018CEF77F|nr:uncharacterized threonine-rich GPI-anchored glycoprotein PJ4664.02 [Teleopsis dalmanni]